MFVYILLGIATVSPLVFLLPKRVKRQYIFALISAAAAISIGIAGAVLFKGENTIFREGSDIVFGWTMIAVDDLSALFMITISVVALAVGIYSYGYLEKYMETKPSAHISLHLMSLLVMYVSMIFVVISRDAFGFLLSWELMTISSFLLIIFDAQRNSVRRAALNYLVIMHIGFIFLLVGFVTLSTQGLPPTFDSLRGYFAENNPLPLFIVFLIGFGLKAGIFPLHVWLPEAHPAAPSHVSAFMSGIMIKMGVYGVIRVFSYLQTELFTIGVILLCVGIVTGLWGAVLAAVQNDMKRLLAYSSIENIGIIFIAIGASGVGAATGNKFLTLCAMSGALLHTVNHSMFKTLLFFGAGNVYTETNTTSLDKLGGLARRMPLTATLFLVGVVAITALPPLNGFISEYLIYYGFFDALATNDSSVVAAVAGIISIALIGGIIILAFSKLFGITFLGSPRSDAVLGAKEVDKSRLIGSAIPAAGILFVGLFPFIFTKRMFYISGDFMNIQYAGIYYSQLSPQMFNISVAVIVLLASIGALLYYRKYQLSKQVEESSPVWGCGFTAPTSKMQYTGESYSEGLYSVSTSMTHRLSEGEVVDKEIPFPTQQRFDVRHKDKVSSLFNEWWSRVMHRINVRVMRLNTGKVNHYILYALMFLVLILMLSILKII